MERNELAKRIDHTLLGQTASEEGVRTLCEEARTLGVASVCVNPCHVVLAHDLLRGTRFGADPFPAHRYQLRTGLAYINRNPPRLQIKHSGKLRNRGRR